MMIFRAFGSTEAFNDRTCIAKGTAELMLSAQHTASCCGLRECFSFGCDGGQPAYAWDWLTSSGVVTGGDNEDIGKDDTCWPYELPEYLLCTFFFVEQQENPLYMGRRTS